MKKNIRNLKALFIFLCLFSTFRLYAQLPSFKEISIDICAEKGTHSVFIPYISDGDNGTQTVTITSATSSNDTIVAVDSFSYDNQYHMGLLYITEFGYTDTVDISITIDDGVDGTYTGDITINVIEFSTAAHNGVNYEYYDKAHWQPEPDENDVPWPGSYQVIPTTNGPNENMEKDFFWQVMYGYIIPPTTGDYVFLCEENEGGFFRMNLNDGISQDFADLTLIGEDNSYSTMIETDSISLQGGKPYFFRFSSKDIVNSQPFWIKWVMPGNPNDTLLIDSTNLITDIDIESPTIPEDFHAKRTGVNFILLSWEESTDNHEILGYNVYINGELFKDSIQELYCSVDSLTDSTEYTLAIEAIDVFNLSSGFSNFLNVTTYPADTIKPTSPQNLNTLNIAPHAIEISWNPVIDTATEIRGYNIFFNGTQVNTMPILENRFTNTNLIPENIYNIQVSAIDAGLNESILSDTLKVTTPYFPDISCPWGPCYQYATVSFKTEAFDNFPGIGLQIKHDKSSVLSSNKLPYGHFEDISYESGIDKDSNKKYGNLVFYQTDVNPHNGNYSAELSGSDGDSINCCINGEIHSNTFDYLIRFACRKDTQYSGEVDIKLSSSNYPNVHTETITPTNDWQLYEITIDPSYDGIATNWYLTYSLEGDSGTIYLDELEFHIAEHYIPGSPFSSKGIELLEEFNPSGLRWGGIEANKEEFSKSTGPHTPNNLSFADMVYLSNTYGNGYSFLTTGVGNVTDWNYWGGNTFTTFTDYLAGDSTTIGGARRIAEGYKDLISDSKQIIVDIGNEVWGGVSHNADIGDDYSEYGNWARSKALKMKESPFYDSRKIITAYSGRSPDYYTSLHEEMLSGDNDEVDWLAISGYMGGNMDLEAWPWIETPSEYIKNGYENFRDKLLGIEGIMIHSFNITGRNIPLYFYEGNMSTTSFYGSLAQAILITDYYTYALRNGIEQAVVYNLYGGQWSIIKDQINYEKYPLFYTSALMNKTCIGNSLTTIIQSNGTLEDANGNTITDFHPIGAYTFNNDDKYTIALFSREIDYHYRVGIDIPNNLIVDTMAIIHTITAYSFDYKDIIYTIDTIYDFTDSIIIDMPTHTMKVISFSGNIGVSPYVPIESVNISIACCACITEDHGYNTITAFVDPPNASIQGIEWTVIENNVGAICGPYSGGFIIQGSGTCDGNGNVIIKACSEEDSTICDYITIEIYNQEDDEGCDVISISENKLQQISIYPNPAQEVINIQLINDNKGSISISNIQGAMLINKNISSNNTQVDISSLSSGIYIIKVETDSEINTIRFIKK